MIFFLFQFLHHTTECLFGYIDTNIKNELLINYLFLIFKIYLYFSRDIGILNFFILKAKIIKVRKIEEQIAKNNACKSQEFRRKWDVLQHLRFFEIS